MAFDHLANDLFGLGAHELVHGLPMSKQADGWEMQNPELASQLLLFVRVDLSEVYPAVVVIHHALDEWSE